MIIFTFSIEEGEIFGLLGPNGSGKSTTIQMLIALNKPSNGQIDVLGCDVSLCASKVKENIGVLLQQTSVNDELSVWENLEFHGRMHHIANPERQNRINLRLEYVGLSDRRKALVKTLSGGMKRRLQIARALLHEPKILFLDEIRDSNLEDIFVELTGHQLN